MSYEIIKSIAFKKDSVFISSATNNVSPRVYNQWSADTYNEIYRQNGLSAFLKEFTKDVWDGNYHLSPSGSKYVKALQASFDAMDRYDLNLKYFLDTDRGAELIANVTTKYLSTHTFSDQDFALYEALRSDPKAVLEVCSKNPKAFPWATVSIQKDRDTAKAYIEHCSGHLLFEYPRYFRDDKELAMAALKNNGCIYRELDYTLRCDRDVTNLAFASNLEGRTFHEHLLNLIPPALRQDPVFMQEILCLCPQIHLHRALEILDNRETAIVAAQVCTPVPYIYENFFDEQLNDPAFQEIIFSRCNDSKSLEQLKSLYSKRNLPTPFFAQTAGSLDSIIASASARQQKSQQGREELNNQETKDNSPDL